MKTSFLTLILVICSLTAFAQWQTNGSNLYYNSGNIGIGTDIPERRLHINSSDYNLSFTVRGGIRANYVHGEFTNSSDGVTPDNQQVHYGIHTDGTFFIDQQVSGKNLLYVRNSSDNVQFSIDKDGNLDVDGNVNLSSGNNFLIDGVPISSGSSLWNSSGNNLYYNSGNIGIGTDTPSDNLHVLGSSLPVLKVESNTTSNGILRLKGGGSGSLNWNIYSTGSGATESAGKLVFGDGIHGDGTGVQSRMLIDNNGNIGIGTGYSELSEKLEINGNVLIKENNALILTSPNGTEYKITVDDSGNLTTSEVTGKKSMTIETDIDIFPNPSTNLINIRINEQNINETDIEIFSISGRMVFMKNYNSNSFSVNISDLKRGTYILKLKDKKGNLLKTQKIIKQ